MDTDDAGGAGAAGWTAGPDGDASGVGSGSAGPGAGGAAELVGIFDLAGSPRGCGFVADDRGTVLTAQEVVDGLDRVVLSAPGGSGRPVVAGEVTLLPGAGLALVRSDGLGVRPLPVAVRDVVEPGAYVRLAARGWRQARVLGGVRVAYGTVPGAVAPGAGPGAPGLGAIELAIGTDGRDAIRAGGEVRGGPVLDALTGAVLAVVGTALRGEHGSGVFALPLRAAAVTDPRGPLAELLARNAATVPAYDTDLNLAGALQLTGTTVGQAAPAAGPELVERESVVRELDAFTAGDRPVLGLIGEPGVGRTTELAALAARRARGAEPAPTVWLRGADLRAGDGSLGVAVGRALAEAARIVAAPRVPAADPALGERIAELAVAAGRPLLVLLDAPEEMPPHLAHRLAAWTAGTVAWLRETGARLIVAGRPEHWERAGALYPAEALYSPGPGRPAGGLPAALRLGDLTPAEAALARARYGIPDECVHPSAARHPLALRLLSGIRAAGVTEGRPTREDVFAAHLDLAYLRVALRVSASGRDADAAGAAGSGSDPGAVGDGARGRGAGLDGRGAGPGAPGAHGAAPGPGFGWSTSGTATPGTPEALGPADPSGPGGGGPVRGGGTPGERPENEAPEGGTAPGDGWAGPGAAEGAGGAGPGSGGPGRVPAVDGGRPGPGSGPAGGVARAGSGFGGAAWPAPGAGGSGPAGAGLGGAGVCGAGVGRLAARVGGRVHEAARRCLGPGQGQLDRASFEELFPWRTGWASAVLAEGLLVPAGPDGYRPAHEELSDWLQAAHLDVPTALDTLVHRPTPAAGLPVPRHRIGPVLEALLLLPDPLLTDTLRPLVDVLERPGADDDPRWWAGRLLRGALARRADALPQLPVLHALAEHVSRTGPGPFGGAFGGRFWNRLRLPEDVRLDLLRRLLPADPPVDPFAPGTGGAGDDRFLDAAARRLVRDPRRVQPLLCAWFGDDRRLHGRPGATVATAAQALLHTHRRLAADGLTEALVTAAHPRADELLAVLAEEEPSAVSRAVDRWAHDERPERRVAAAAYGLAAAAHVRTPADRELLRYAARAILARPADASLHGSALAILLRDPRERARYLPDALACFRERRSRLPAAELVAVLPLLPDPDAVLDALGDRADGEVLCALAALTTPALSRRAAELVGDHLARCPGDAPYAAAFVDRRLEQGAPAGPVLRPLVLLLLRGPAPVRAALAEVLAAPGNEASYALRGELADVLLDSETDAYVLDALLGAVALGAAERCADRTRELLRRTGRQLLRAPGGAAVFDRRVVELARALPVFGALVDRWLAAAPAEAAALLGPSARRMIETLNRDACTEAGAGGTADGATGGASDAGAAGATGAGTGP
ncbi:hypothetical protein [Streptomyces sp. G-G2]|uniref:hypothetical protein n=1 Tax=Streptomyces sp. G-G2 TaxID=3046201 RepID=UPI0024B8A131|nr:hypothetical protein [Streptomyces sp. G-G2]MDJ0383841.1 hypothetical protein [Streptomyces sp. G-G2]